MLVEDDGTGRRTLDVEGLSRGVLAWEDVDAMLYIEGTRLFLLDRPRDGGGGASPKMKNLMKAKINSTTEICPRRKPCVKDKLDGSRAVSVKDKKNGL